MNKTFHVGYLVKKPEVRSTSTGKSVALFTLGVKRNYKNANGEYESDFINCRAFGHTGSFIGQYCDKGDLVAVEGCIRTGSYSDKNGDKQYTINIVADNVKLLNKKNAQKKEISKEDEQVDIYSEFGDEIDDNYLD